MSKRLNMDLAGAIRPFGTADDRRGIHTTEDRRPVETASQEPAARTNEKIRLQIAIYNAVCPHCGAANFKEEGSIAVIRTCKSVRYTTCKKCGKPGPKVVVK